MKPRLLMITLLLSIQLWGQHATATTTLPLSLERMTSSAAIIFYGRVIDSEVKADPVSGQVVTFTDFEVLEMVKGDVGKTYRIKQIGGQLPGSTRRLVIQGVPQFSINQEYVVFLPEASRLGFASPIGLSQGKFDVHRLNGEAMVNTRRMPGASTSTATPPSLKSTPAAVDTAPGSGQPTATRVSEFLQRVRGAVKE